MKEASLLFRWAKDNILSIRAEHLLGVNNQKTDWLSKRQLDEGEWSLHPGMFKLIIRDFGQPTVDLFASRENAQLPLFVQWCLT